MSKDMSNEGPSLERLAALATCFLGGLTDNEIWVLYPELAQEDLAEVQKQIEDRWLEIQAFLDSPPLLEIPVVFDAAGRVIVAGISSDPEEPS